jgi:hypothetical protein
MGELSNKNKTQHTIKDFILKSKTYIHVCELQVLHRFEKSQEKASANRMKRTISVRWTNALSSSLCSQLFKELIWRYVKKLKEAIAFYFLIRNGEVCDQTQSSLHSQFRFRNQTGNDARDRRT